MATLGGLLCAAAFVLVTFLPSHAYGHSCGSWTSPNYGTGLSATLDRLDSTTDAAAMSDLEYRLVTASCDGSLDTRRVFALLFLALGVGVRFGVPYVVRRDEA